MPAIWLEVKFKGKKGEVEALSLLNSGSDIVVLPKVIANEISPVHSGRIKVELANGKIIKRDAYYIEIEVKNIETGKKRRAKVLATIEKRDYPLIGVAALEKLKLMLDIVNGKVIFV